MNPDSAINTLTIETAVKDRVVDVVVRGDAGFHHAYRLDETLANIAASKPALVNLDLSGVTFISSIALGAMLSLKQDVHRDGGRLQINAISLPVLSLLSRMHLARSFGLTEDQIRRAEEWE